MAWSMVGTPKVEKITRKLAKRFAEMEPAPNDRPLRDSRVSFLKKSIIEDKFRTCEWAEVTCKQTGKLYRINGKHTSTLLAGMNGDFPTGLSAIVERFTCDNLEDVASLYSTFDTRASARTQSDINRLFAASNPELAEIPLHIISRCISGMSYVTYAVDLNVIDAKATPEQKAHLIVEHPGFVCWVNRMLAGKPKDWAFLNRGPVVAAMFKTYQKSQKASDEFWVAVKEGTGDKPTLPDRKLQKHLMSTSLSLGRGIGTGKVKDDTRAMYARCINAWNAWRKGETTELKYYASAKLPTPV